MARGSVTASSQKINFGYHASLDSLAALTICGHVYWAAAVDFAYVLGTVDVAQNNGWSLQRYGSGNPNHLNWLVSIRNAGVNFGRTSDNSIALNTWYWVAAVYDGSLSGNANRLKLFIDDVQKTLTFSGTIPATIGASADDVCLFNNEAANESYPSVNLEDLKFFNAALTPNELAGLRGGRMVRHDALKLWPVLWGTHDPEIDLSGSGLSGTLTNNPAVVSGPPRTLYTPKWAALEVGLATVAFQDKAIGRGIARGIGF